MKAMKSCTDEWIHHWGIDVAVNDSLIRYPHPKGNPANWVGPKDYPQVALSKGYSATVYFRLNVDATGKPTACHIQKVVGAEIFGEVTCDLLMHRARFEPALNAQSKPVASDWRSTVQFQA